MSVYEMLAFLIATLFFTPLFTVTALVTNDVFTTKKNNRRLDNLVKRMREGELEAAKERARVLAKTTGKGE